MIAVFDPASTEYEHLVFNAAFLACLRKAFPGEEMVFFGERSHVRLLKDCLNDYRVALNNVSLRSIRRLGWIRHALFRRSYISKVHLDCLNIARRLGARRNIFLRVTTPGLLTIKLFATSLFRDLGLTLVLHSYHHIYEPWPAVVRSISRATFRYGNTDNLKYLLLSPVAHANTIREFPGLASRAHWTHLPYLFRSPENSNKAPGRLRFGFIGRGDSLKGLPDFLQMAGEVQKMLPEPGGRADFIGVGTLGPHEHHLDQRSLAVPLRLGPVPREEYERLVSTVDYAVHPFTESWYRQSASASVMDAFSLGKPLIASKIPYFEDLFQRMGDIGYLYKDYPEMVDIVKGLIEDHPAERYARQRENIIRGRSLFEPSTVADDLRLII